MCPTLVLRWWFTTRCLRIYHDYESQTTPKEVWANTFSTCNGYPPPDEFNFLTVSCSVLRQAREAKVNDVAVPGSVEWKKAGLD